MVQAIISIDDDTNRVLNIIKAKYGLRDKSTAIEVMAQQYKEDLLEPALRPEYMGKLKKIEAQKGIRFKNMAGLRNIIEK